MQAAPLSQQPVRPRRAISLRWWLVLTFGGLIAVALLSVLAITIWANAANTFSLLNDRAVLLLDGMQDDIRDKTRAAGQVPRTLATLYADGKFEIDQPEGYRQILRTLISAVPVVETIIVIDQNNNRAITHRGPNGEYFDIPFGPSAEDAPVETVREIIENGGGGDDPVWSGPHFINDILFHFAIMPLKRNGAIDGVVIAAIGRHNLNLIAVELAQSFGTTAFILDRGNLVAHSGYPEFFEGKASVAPADFPDTTMVGFAGSTALDQFDSAKQKGVSITESEGADGHVFITRKFAGLGGHEYVLGAYFEKTVIEDEVERLALSALAGLAALFVAIVLAVLLARRISRPLYNIAKVANHLSDLELDAISPLPRSRIREIDEQARAMNAMTSVIGQFIQYVPKSLVSRLIQSGTDSTRSVEREVTILFSDVAGFTSLCETMNAVETAEFINRHFELVAQCIARNHGTVDKFMGDGVMAFWGAPDADDDHAAHAVAAAKEIMVAQHAQNRARAKGGLKSLRMRIGIHTGRVVVGNIGGGDRLNYTIVGDAVNVANRLEQLGKEIDPDAEILILASEQCVAKLPSNSGATWISKRLLRGREHMIGVYRIDAEGIAATFGEAGQDAVA